MSRTPVREALNSLEKDGLIEVIPRRGVRVLPLSSKDMAEIYTILTSLESTAAEQVANQGLSSEQLAQLQDSVDSMESALHQNNLLAWAEADARFHKQLVELAQNERLTGMVEMLLDQAHRARMITLKLRPKPAQSNVDHQAVIDAIARRDGKAAFAIHRDHREKSGTMLIKLLDDLGLNQL